MTDEPDWASYRQGVFGEPYMVWHDGPDFTEIASRFAADPDYVLAMLRKGILENDDVAAQVPRHVNATEEQKSALVAMLEEVMPQTYGGARTEVATSLHALGGSPDLAQEVVEVLLAPHHHWGVRLDAARRLATFAPTPDLVAAVATGAQDEDYLVRYHSANTLLRWAGRTDEVSEVDDVFTLLVAEGEPESWKQAAETLAAAVPLD